MEPIDVTGALLRRWWVVVALGVVGALVAILFVPSSHAKPVHSEAAPVSSWPWTANAIVGAPPVGGGGSSILGGRLNTNQIVFYSQEQSVLEAAAKSVGLNKPVSELQKAVVALSGPKFTAPGTVLLTAYGPTPGKASAFANAYAFQLGKYMDGLVSTHQLAQAIHLQQEITDLRNKINAAGATNTSALQSQLQAYVTQQQALAAIPTTTGYEVVRPASPSSAVRMSKTAVSITGSKKTIGLVGLVVGLLAGAGLVLLLEFLDKRLRNSSRGEETFGYPVVVEIPAPSKADGHEELPLLDPSVSSSSPVAEAYRMLRMSVMLQGLPVLALDDGTGHFETLLDASPEESIQDRRQVILVVSAGTEPTRPVVLANLAAAYADSGERVLVASTQDLRLSRHIGNGENVSDEITLEDVRNHLQPSSIENVSSVPLDRFVGSISQLASRAPDVLDAARQLADVVIVEAPGLLAFHDGEALMPSVDVVLVVGQCLTTTFEHAKRAGDLLRRIAAPVLGIVLTNVEVGAKDVRRSAQLQLLQKINLESRAEAPAVREAIGVASVSSVEGEESKKTEPVEASSGNGHAEPVKAANGHGNGHAEPVKAANGHGNGHAEPVKAANGHGNGHAEPVKAANGHGNGHAEPVKAANGHGNGHAEPVKAANGHGNGQAANGHGNGQAANGHGNGDAEAVKAANGNGNGDAEAVKAANGNGNGDAEAVKAANGNGNGDAEAVKAANGNGNGDAKKESTTDPGSVVRNP